ncbi:MAG TPA: hypothetical protein VL854_06475, partial [Nitrososphaeraceae archaeon]|nr:hypothetical protein [Nitrososphaeraceae archaeon]
YQVNGRQLEITGGKITKNTLTAADWGAADAAFNKATGLHLPTYGTGGTGGGTGGYVPGSGTTQGDSEGSAPGWGGATYVPSAASYNFAPGVVAGGYSPGTGGIGGLPGTGTGGTGGGGGTNVGGINFPPGFPFQDIPKGPGGGPVIGGIEFPAGFPFNDTGVPGGVATGTGAGGTGSTGNSSLPVGGTNTGTGTGVTQTQSITQNSSIIGQGNNSNIDYQSGQNSRLRIQNGVVVEATGIYSGYKVGDPLPGMGGGTGTGGTGTGNTSGIPASLAALMQQAPIIPRITSNIYDAMGIPMGNEADPLRREFGFNRILDTGGVGGNNPNNPGGNTGGGAITTMNRLLAQLTQFVQTLLGKTIGTKSLWENMSNITSSNIGNLP